jgi:ADP-heptose:LPS heptosyltransferase
MNILVVREDKLGDVILSTPLYESLKAAYPNCTISLWVGKGTSTALKGNPFVDRVKEVSRRPKGAEFWELFAEIRRRQFHAVLLLRNDASTFALLSRLAGIGIISGASAKISRLLLTENRIEDEQDWSLHDVEKGLRRATCLGKTLQPYPLRLFWATEDLKASAELNEGLYFVVHPFTGGTSETMTDSAWREVVEKLVEQTGLTPVVTGTSHDHKRFEGLALPGVVSMVGKTSLQELAALVSRAAFVVCGNTSIVHVASACKTPVVLVEAQPPVEARISRWGPWMTSFRAVTATRECPGCTDWHCHRKGTDCVESISSEQVVSAALDLVKVHQ